MTASSRQALQKPVKLGYLLFLGWTLFLILLFVWNYVQLKDSVQQEALIALRMAADKDLTFRAWATNHGGVYVPVTAKTPPNPFLPEEMRVIITTDGAQFTLLNPAYIMRQVYEADSKTKGSPDRLVSVQPVNPINEADPWESESLQIFEQDPTLTELSTVSDLHGQTAIRLIKPFYIEEGCLKCHADQGYQVGDLRGAISSSRPLAPYAAIMHSRQLSLLLGYGVIWLVGILGIGAFIRQMNASARILREKEIRNRAMVEAIPDLLFRYSSVGVYLDAELKDRGSTFEQLPDGFSPTHLIGYQIENILPQEVAATLHSAIGKVLKNNEMEIVEYSYAVEQQRFWLEERLVKAGENEVISIVRDITRQKESEARLKYLSFHDELTGLYNRHYFENELQRLNGGREYPISIIYSDVNGLKSTNDTYGHVVGDQLLKACAQVLKGSLRASDVLSRVGGDEFVALLPNTSAKRGAEVVDRIKSNVEAYNTGNSAAPLQLAVGIATTENKTEDLQDTYARADRLMYRDKPKNRATNGST